MKRKGISSKQVSRRDFLKTGATAGAVFAAGAITAPYYVPATVFGANAPSERIGIGAIGMGEQGSGNMRSFIGNRKSQVVAVCDVDDEHMERARVKAKLSNEHAYRDFRELLDRKDVDAVSIGTPDHWHMLNSVAAVKAGKDVYCEKPLTLTIRGGRILADACKRHGRIVQTGSQQRSASNFRYGCELVRNGRIGKVVRVEVGIPSNNRQCEPTWKPEPIPPVFDYDLWLGPAPWAPYHSQRCHYQFRFILDYSGGQVTNWGAHHLDIAQWGLGADDSGPIEVIGDGEFPQTGLFTTATRVYFKCKYANGATLICKTGGGGTKFIGAEGWVYVNRGKIDAEPKSLLTSKIKPDEIHLYKSRDHKQDFLDCIQSRRQPICPAEVGHRSATICHLGNIAMRLKRRLQWDPKNERFLGDDEANHMTFRPMRAPWAL